MADNAESTQDYKKLEKLSGEKVTDEDEATKTTEPFIQQDPDPESSKPLKEQPYPGAKRSTYRSIGIVLIIVFVVIAIISIAAAILITQDKSRSMEINGDHTDMDSTTSIASMMSKASAKATMMTKSSEMQTDQSGVSAEPSPEPRTDQSGVTSAKPGTSEVPSPEPRVSEAPSPVPTPP